MTDDRKTGIGIFLIGLSIFMTGAMQGWPVVVFFGGVLAIVGVAAWLCTFL